VNEKTPNKVAREECGLWAHLAHEVTQVGEAVGLVVVQVGQGGAHSQRTLDRHHVPVVVLVRQALDRLHVPEALQVGRAVVHRAHVAAKCRLVLLPGAHAHRELHLLSQRQRHRLALVAQPCQQFV